jgi:NADPH-dependent 2,4-dienoyl-CoA reductase/sulfur reductase-like enzyme
VLDIRDVLAERAKPGRRVLVIAQDDHVAPLSVADFLAERGHEVTVVYATAQPAPLLGRYIVGGILGRLDARDVRMRFMEEVVAIGERTAELRNVYSLRTRPSDEYDSVVLACGSVADAALYDALRSEPTDGLPDVHVLGDAFATRQAYALAERLLDPSARPAAA